MSNVKIQVVDPVCGMTIDKEDAVSVTHAGTVYYFCEEACAGIFRDEPERWIHSDTADLLEHHH